MKKVSLFFFLAITTFANTIDTLNTLANNAVKIPVAIFNINYISLDISRSDYSSNVKLDAKKHVENSHVGLLTVGVRKELNSDFVGCIVDTVYKAGNYQYSYNFYVSNNDRRSASDKVNYFVKVDYPKLASPDINRDTLFVGENFSFSTAAVGYDDPAKYKIVINIGEETKQIEKEYMADLKEYLVAENAGKTITVKSFYNGRQFRYYNQNGSDTLSTWSFFIKSPQLIQIHRWTKNDLLVPIDNPQYTLIKLFYEDMDNNQTITVVPKEYKITDFKSNNRKILKNAIVGMGKNSFAVRLVADLDQLESNTTESANFSFNFVTELGTTLISSDKETQIYKTR